MLDVRPVRRNSHCEEGCSLFAPRPLRAPGIPCPTCNMPPSYAELYDKALRRHQHFFAANEGHRYHIPPCPQPRHLGSARLAHGTARATTNRTSSAASPTVWPLSRCYPAGTKVGPARRAGCLGRTSLFSGTPLVTFDRSQNRDRRVRCVGLGRRRQCHLDNCKVTSSMLVTLCPDAVTPSAFAL
jgi:hypothetical protein